MAVDISRALAINGWMSPEELTWLATQAQYAHRIVEIGSYAGRSTRALADNTPGKVYAIDIWSWGPWAKDIDWMTEEEADQYERFAVNLADHIEQGKVIPIQALSVAAASRVTNGFDMIFIDGAHDYDSVREDIKAWLPMSNGLFCGHDYDHPGVRKAVEELVLNHTNVVGTIWMRLQP